MVKKISNIYLGGPPLVKAALGEVISGTKYFCRQSNVVMKCGRSRSKKILRVFLSILLSHLKHHKEAIINST
jgi:hypothetical protein